MAKDHKVILDLWDDEPLNNHQVSNSRSKPIVNPLLFDHRFPSKSSSSNTNSASQNTLPNDQEKYAFSRSVTRSEQPTPVMPAALAPKHTQPTISPKAVKRQEHNTIPMQIVPAEHKQPNVQNSPQGIHTEALLAERSMPSTKPAPLNQDDHSFTNEQVINQEQVVDQQQLTPPASVHINSESKHNDDLSGDENLRVKEESWLPLSVSSEETYDFNSDIPKLTAYQYDFDPLADSSHSLQDLINSDWQEELKHRHKQSDYSRLKNAYEASKAPNTPFEFEQFEPEQVINESNNESSEDHVKDFASKIETRLESKIETRVENKADNIEELPSAQTLLTELFPSKQPIQMEMDHIEVEDALENALEDELEDLPTEPPRKEQPSQYTYNQSEYIEPLSFTIPPQSQSINLAFDRYEAEKYDISSPNTTLDQTKDQETDQLIDQTVSQHKSLDEHHYENVKSKSSSHTNQALRAHRKRSNFSKNIFKAEDLSSGNLQQFQPSAVLSEDSLNRRKKLSRVLVQGVERYATGQISFSPLTGVATLPFVKIQPIQIALSSEPLNTQLAHISEADHQLLKNTAMDVSLSSPVDGQNPEGTEQENQNLDSEHKEFLATVEFQTLLSGSSSVKAPQNNQIIEKDSQKRGWDLEQHLNPKQQEIPLSNRKNQRKTPPRLIQALESNEVNKPSEQKEDEVYPVDNTVTNQMILNETTKDTDQVMNPNMPEPQTTPAYSPASSPTSSSSPVKPSSPRPSGHPSVKVRLWGLK